MRSRIANTIVHSFDFDGMLASYKYVNKLKSLILRADDEDRALDMKDYHELAEYIFREYSDFFDNHFTRDTDAEHIIYVGSDRQDHKTDMDNGFKVIKGLHITLSCFPFFTALTAVLKQHYHLDIKLAELLLEDIYLQLPPGTSFKNISQAWLTLDKSFYHQLAAQLKIYNADESHRLFMELRKIITSAQDNHSTLSPRLPKYKDSGKILIIIAQILDAHTRQGKGRMCIDYHLADDRRDILSNAIAILSPQEIKTDSKAERRSFPLKPFFPSEPEETPTTLLSLVPETTHIYLEQFIPPEDKNNLQEIDPHRFGNFVQPHELVGTGKGEREIKDIYEDIQGTHNLLNQRELENPVSSALIETVELNAQKNALALISRYVNELIAHEPASKIIVNPAFKTIQKIHQALNDGALPPEQKLAKIQKLCAKILPNSTARFLDFNRKFPEHAILFKTLADIHPKNPRTDSLIALSHLFTQQPSNARLEK